MAVTDSGAPCSSRASRRNCADAERSLARSIASSLVVSWSNIPCSPSRYPCWYSSTVGGGVNPGTQNPPAQGRREAATGGSHRAPRGSAGGGALPFYGEGLHSRRGKRQNECASFIEFDISKAKG